MILTRRWRLACLVFALLSVTACSNSTATDAPEESSQAKPLTRAECLAMKVKEEKITCIKTLTAQRKATTAETEKRIAALKKGNDERRRRNEALLKEFEESVLDEK